MKKLNLIKRLWTDSHEKQTPQRFARYAVMLMMLLTIGVGQMWADCQITNTNNASFYNTVTNSSLSLTNDDNNHYYGNLYVKGGTTYERKWVVGGSGWSNWYKQDRDATPSGNYEGTVCLNTGDGNDKFTTPGTTSKYYKLYIDLWCSYDWGSKVKFYYDEVSALSPSLSGATTAMSGGDTREFSSSCTGGSGGYTYAYTCRNTTDDTDASSALSATSGTSTTFTAPVAGTAKTYRITVTATDANSQLTGLGFSNKSTYKDITVNATLTPTIAWAASDPISSYELVSGESVTLKVTRSNSSANITYKYKVGDGSWQTIVTQSGTTYTYTPAANNGATKTYYFKAVLNDTGSPETSVSSAVTQYGKKTIHVRNINNWTNFYVYRYNSNSDYEQAWHGNTTGISDAAGQWKDVVMTSKYAYFIFNDNGTNQITGSNTYSYASTITDGGYYTIQEGSSSSLNFTSTTAPAAPTATTNDANEITSTTAKFNYSVNANRDKTTPGIAFKQSDDDIDAATIYSSGTKVAGSATNGNASGSTAAQTITPGKKYYYVAYGMNGFGTSYGTVKSFVAPYKVTITQPTGCSAITPGTGTRYVHIGDEISSTATTGYTFSSWSVTNVTLSSPETTEGVTTSTITSISADNGTIQPVYTENMTTVNLIASPAGKGTFTSGGTVTFVSAGVATKPTVTAVPATGYHLAGTIWSESSDYISLSSTTTDATTITATGATGKTADLTATFTPNTYRVHFHRNGGAGLTVYQNFTYDVAQNLTANSYTRTGYTFAGWALTTDGVVTYANSVEVSNLTSENGVDYHLYAKWTPNPYAITFDATTNGGSLEGVSPKNVIFDETSVTSCPTATKDGYCFDGWYTKASSGQKVINADGSLVESVTDESQYTGTGGAWKKASATTVYAVYVAPTIEMTPDPTALNSRKTEKDTVVIHQTFSCVPTGNYNVVYTVGYSANHTQLPSQPTIKYGTGVGAGHDTIKMPMDANTYEIVAELRTGSTRGAGTIVKRDTIDYVVEAQYAVTLHYVVDGKNIRESRQVYAYPTSAPSEVRVFMEESGYELDYWEMGVGIDSVTGRGSRTDEGGLGIMEHKYIYAANNGNIYLHYKPKTNTVYFFNTFDKYWYSTIMKKYDYGTTDGYWQSTYGAGSKTGPSTGILTPDTVKMTTTDLSNLHWMASIGSTTTNFAFVSEKKSQEHFWGEIEGNKYPKVIYRTDYNAATPMFVPVSKNVDEDYYILNQNATGEAHYYRGFWVKYSPSMDSTGYYLKVYNGTAYGSSLIESIPLRLTQTGEGNTWELTASMDLEANKTYGFKFTKATGTSSVDWYTNGSTMTAADHEGWVFTSAAGNNCGLTTTSAGDYTFHVFCKDFGTKAANAASASDVQGQLAVTVDYATVSGDYRVIYSDATQTEVIASPSIHPLANGQDTVSFFIRKNAESRVMKIQRYTTNWADLKTVDLSSIAKDSVYVLYLQQNEGANDIEVAGYDFYDGDYYIRTDCVDEHKWDYKQSLDNHRMSPSDYGMADIQPDKFTHYYVHWIGKGGNVKFIVANKYAPCLSDTVITDTYANVAGGNLPSGYGANVRFMYNKGTNKALRAYLHGSEEGDSDYLKITTSTSQMGTTATPPVVITAKTFNDEKNWVYQAEIKAKPGLTAKLTAEYDGKTQYFIGSADKEESIIGGTGDAWQKILLTYDFKVNRLICAWQPSGDSINGDVPINADVMIIRHGQDDAQQIIFKNNASKLSAVKYIYSVMQFNRDDMVGMMPRWDYWSYQHCMYYISFPYDVLVNDIMAPGRMGTEWRIQRYNGAKRAKGWFAGDGVTTFWEDVQAGDTLKAYEGYSLLLNRRIFNDGSSTVWQNKGAGTKLYMYFPSKDATTGVVANKTVEVTVPSHECTLDRIFDQDLGKPTYEQRNHKIVDSHWNMIGTPLFEDKVASTITAGPTIEASTGSATLQYIYEWNPAGNTLGIRNALTTGFEFKTMYSYMAQYAGTITFVGSAVNKIVAANRSANKKNYTINLELTKDDTFVGRTYVELRENAVDTFLLNEDVCMVKNGVSADMYTLAGAYEAGANVLSIDNHIVPVGVDVKAAGTYTFSMPSNFDGEIILVDNYMQTRTNLMMEDYEIALPKANISDRFYLEININKMPTAIDGVGDGEGTLRDGKVHKFIMNDQMYILKDGQLFDATGKRVQ